MNDNFVKTLGSQIWKKLKGIKIFKFRNQTEHINRLNIFLIIPNAKIHFVFWI